MSSIVCCILTLWEKNGNTIIYHQLITLFKMTWKNPGALDGNIINYCVLISTQVAPLSPLTVRCCPMQH